MKMTYFIEYEISGKNFPLLIQKLNLKNIPFKNLYKIDNGYRLSVEKKDCKAVEDILNQSWKYTIISVSGTRQRVNALIKKAGLILGMLVFFVGAFFADNILLKVSYCGDYNYFYRDIQAVLERNSVKKYSRFSDIDCTDLSEQIYAQNPLICYSSVKKQGNFLIIEVKKSQDYSANIDTSKMELKATVDGKILELKVYRGVAIKKVGDEVKKGDLIVSGERVEEGKIYPSFVLARVAILKTYEYSEKGEDTIEARAQALARAKLICGAEDYYFEQTTCEKGKILVKLEYIIILGG